VILLTGPAWAQNQNFQGDQQDRLVYYDTFNQRWLDPEKWSAWGPYCSNWGTLECVREIQNGRLRLAVRNIGATDSDSGFQFGQSDLQFANPLEIKSITADVTLSRFSGISCSTNSDQPSMTIVKVAGNFFNAGTSFDPAEDVTDDLYLWVDPSNPKTMIVANWLTGAGLAVSTPIGSYPIGTPLTLTNAWDQANHQFISVVKVIGESGPGKRVVVSYPVSDTELSVNPSRNFLAYVFSQNCTSAQTFAQVEVFFDNVRINVVPPRTH
jgi:hypothetical protein